MSFTILAELMKLFNCVIVNKCIAYSEDFKTESEFQTTMYRVFWYFMLFVLLGAFYLAQIALKKQCTTNAEKGGSTDKIALFQLY